MKMCLGIRRLSLFVAVTLCTSVRALGVMAKLSGVKCVVKCVMCSICSGLLMKVGDMRCSMCVLTLWVLLNGLISWFLVLLVTVPTARLWCVRLVLSAMLGVVRKMKFPQLWLDPCLACVSVHLLFAVGRRNMGKLVLIGWKLVVITVLGAVLMMMQL